MVSSMDIRGSILIDVFQTYFEKKYEDPEENARRKAIYFQNKAKIQDHNKQYEAGLSTFTMGINHFADLTDEEFRQTYASGIRLPERPRTKRAAAFTVPEGATIDQEWEAWKVSLSPLDCLLD